MAGRGPPHILEKPRNSPKEEQYHDQSAAGYLIVGGFFLANSFNKKGRMVLVVYLDQSKFKYSYEG
jgi:hypothetical protein